MRYVVGAVIGVVLALVQVSSVQQFVLLGVAPNLVLVMLDEPQRVAASNGGATAGVNAAPTAGKIIARIAPILGVAPKLEDDLREFDAKVVASY